MTKACYEHSGMHKSTFTHFNDMLVVVSILPEFCIFFKDFLSTSFCVTLLFVSNFFGYFAFCGLST